MQQPDDMTMRAFSALRNSYGQQYLIKWLDEIKDRLTTELNQEHIRVLQGEAQALRRVLGYIDPEGFSTSGKRG